MSEYAIRVEKLSKRYRIGKLKTQAKDRHSLLRMANTPFNYLVSTLRPPSAEETLWALKDVSFEVRSGEVIGVIGHNGAGKSTLLKILSRITEPTSGMAFINGRVGSLLEVGTGFHPELTGRENIYLNGAILGMKKAEINRKFDEIVDFAEIEKFIDTPVKRYSSGMYVRLAFAVAAHLEPEILLVDEVLAVGDAAFQKKCLNKLGDVAKEGRTILFVSHNLAAIKSLCQNAILLEKGEVNQIGSSDKVVSSYLSKELGRGLNGRLWSYSGNAPANTKAYIYSVRIFDQNDELADQVSLENPVVIEVGYCNLTTDLMLNVSISIYNQDYICVLSSPSSTDGTWFKKPHPHGFFISRAVIPGNMLNQGRHLVSALLVENGLHIISDIEKCVSIDMVDLGQGRSNWFGTWIGIVRPMLSWQTEYVGPERKS